jgi:hypothetical protein
MARVAGTVVGSDGRPIAGGFVMLRARTSGAGMMNMLNGRVGGDGAFSISNVPPGEHVLEIRPEPRGPDATPEFASMPITVASEDVAGLRITTGRGGSVRGRVVFEGTAARAGAFGAVRVMAQPADPQQFGGAVFFGGGANNGIIADDGTFALDGVNGEVLFRVTASPSWSLRSVTIDGEDVTDTPYPFRGARTLANVTIVMTDKLTELTGTVADDRGRALKDYVVVVLPEEPKEGAAATRFTRTVRPDQEGTFRVRGLPPGRYVAAAVESVEQGGEWSPEFQERVRAAARGITLREGQASTLDLKLATGL